MFQQDISLWIEYNYHYKIKIHNLRIRSYLYDLIKNNWATFKILLSDNFLIVPISLVYLAVN